MTRATWWAVIGVVYTAINAGGAVIAFMRGEWMHGSVHVALLAVGAGYVAWRLGRDRPQRDGPVDMDLDRRLRELQQSVDAVALEVGRIEEHQRDAVKIMAHRKKREALPPQ
ncbi:MAG TPA: hypothetical protein VJ867_12535 [Gemmatimonadaceae bacterium]|nr:hypothetical protein [Gemmatimonadaceae bacterium]